MISLPQRAAVLYHHPCPDGAFAALAAYLYHSALGIPVEFFPNTVYSPLRVNDLEIDKFDIFYLLDFIGPEGFVLELCSKAKEVVILDHHKTAYESLVTKCTCPLNLTPNFDMNKSGATLAYDYFTKNLQRHLSSILGSGLTEEERKKMLTLVPLKDSLRIDLVFKYIEDADLWKWNLPNSKAFSSGLRQRGIDYNASTNPQLFEELLSVDPTDVITNGEMILLSNQIRIDEAIGKSFPISLGQGKFGQCLAVQGENIEDLRSEIGHQLASKSLSLGLRPIGAVVYEVGGMNPCLIKVSLRSIQCEDTTEISKTYGGGGHHGASSFMINREDFLKWRL